MKHTFTRIALAALVIGSSASAFALPHHHAGAAVHKALDTDGDADDFRGTAQPVAAQPAKGSLPWYLDPALATKTYDSLRGESH